MKFTAFNEHLFRQQVDKGLSAVKKILDTTRNPRLPDDDQEHQYDDKFALAALLTNTALAAYMNVFELMGVTADHLETMAKWVHEDKKTVTMRFQATQSCNFLHEKEVKVVTHEGEVTQVKEESGRLFGISSKTTSVKSKISTKVREYHWSIGLSYKLVIFCGVSPDDESTIALQSRESSTTLIIKGTEKAPFQKVTNHPSVDLGLTWFMENVAPTKQICKFIIDRSDPQKCKTPRRNEQVDQAIQFAWDITEFSQKLARFWRTTVEKGVLGRHAPANPVAETDKKAKLSALSADSLFCPILPLFENNKPPPTAGDGGSGAGHPEPPPRTLLALSAVQDNDSPLMRVDDNDKFLAEQIRTIDEALKSVRLQYPLSADGDVVSTAEATLVLMCLHAERLAAQYKDSVNYIENMLEKQLISAIGKVVNPNDFDEFMSFHYRCKLFGDHFSPSPFCFAIRRPGHFPDGILSIESASPSTDDKMEPVETFTRHIAANETAPPIRVPLNAATTVEITGDRYLHGWIQHRFASGSARKYQLGARARQFSCFLVMVGTVAGPNQFDPKDAIILQNKDEVLIPLLLNELPTAKEFKDAISSLSPEQQRFAKSFREMQLESSVFGVCVVQLKPQLEDLLQLPQGALTKEIRLTQDLLSLFIDYQIPSDLMSHDGPEDANCASKVAVVKEYTKAVMDVIKKAKEDQLGEERQKKAMARAQDHAYPPPGVAYSEDDFDEEEPLARGAAGPGYGGPILCKSAAEPCSAGGFGQFMSGGLGFGASKPPAPESSHAVGSRRRKASRPVPILATAAMASQAAPPPPQEHALRMAAMELGALSLDIGAEVQQQNSFLDAEYGDGSPACDEADLLELGATDAGTQGGDSRQYPSGLASSGEGGTVIDFTQIPKQLDAKFLVHDRDSSLRTTIIKTGEDWRRMRQENLLAKASQMHFSQSDIKSEKDKAFDLLDALSRSGSLPLRYSEIHVVVAVTHCFENDIMGTVIQDNINPIEKVEQTSLLMASTIHGVPSQRLLKSADHIARLQGSFPALFDGQA
jgi:hypothetical protein